MSVTSTGARVVFRVNGAKIAFAQALNFSEQHAHAPVDVLDQLTPAEYAETGYTINFTATMFRVSFQSARNLGLQPKLEDILTQPELQAELVDRISGASLMVVERVKLTQMDMSIDARNLGQMTLSFVGIKAYDEAGA